MIRVRLFCLALAAGALSCSVGAVAQAFTVQGLQRMLQQAPQRELRFREMRESPWLAVPIESSGSLRASATLLEKKVEQPRRETWRILPDRLQVLTPDANAPKELMFSDAPAVATLANAMRRAVAGDLAGLEPDFRLVLSGDQRVWTLQLTPRRPEVARFLKELELQGSGAHLQVIIVLESQGERTVTHLSSAP